MVVTDHDLPLLAAARDTMSDDFASVFEPHSRAGATKHIGPGIDRIGQQPVNRMVARRPPLHDPALGTIDGNRQRRAGSRSRPSCADRRALLSGATPLVNAAGKSTIRAR